MAQLDRSTLEEFFEFQDKPEQSQFTDLIESCVNIVDDSAIQKTVVTISSPEILTLFTTPKIIIPAPGANKVISLYSIIDQLIFNSIAYTVPFFSLLNFYYTDIAGKEAGGNSTLFVDRSVTTLEKVKMNTTQANITENAPIVAQHTSGNPTLGNSIIKVFAFYQIIDLS
jgi:hypothetical protein